MHLSTILTALAVSGAAWAVEPPTMVKRDLATIMNVVDGVGTQLKGLTTAVKSFNGDLTELATVGGKMIQTLNDGVKQIKATTPITLNEAIQLQSKVTGLQNDGNELISALNDKKSAFEKASLCDIIFTQANDLSKTSKELIDAVISKLPQEAQQIATQVSSGFVTSVEGVTKNFAPGSCTNADGKGVAPGAGAGTGTDTGAANGTGSVGSNPSTPVTASAGLVSAPMGLVCAVAVAGLML